ALGQPAQPRTDLYSLGIVLYEILTGRVPFDAEAPMAVMLAQVHQPPPSLCDFAPDVPPALSAAVLSALVKEPNGRPNSAAELAAVLRAAIASVYGESTIA